MNKYASQLMTATQAAKLVGVHKSTLALAARHTPTNYLVGGWEWPQSIGGRWIAPEQVWRELAKRTARASVGGRPRGKNEL